MEGEEEKRRRKARERKKNGKVWFMWWNVELAQIYIQTVKLCGILIVLFQTILIPCVCQCVCVDLWLTTTLVGGPRADRARGLYISVCGWGEGFRVQTAGQIFIEFHLNGHKVSLRPYWAASRENSTNTCKSWKSAANRYHLEFCDKVGMVFDFAEVHCEFSGWGSKFYRGVH